MGVRWVRYSDSEVLEVVGGSRYILEQTRRVVEVVGGRRVQAGAVQ